MHGRSWNPKSLARKRESLSLVVALGLVACSGRPSHDQLDADASRPDATVPAVEPDASRSDGGLDGGHDVTQDVRGDAGTDASQDAGDGGSADALGAGSATPHCVLEGQPPRLAVASAALNESPPLRPNERIQLRGDGVEQTHMQQQNVVAGLRFAHDRMLLVTDQGFWDISNVPEARWYPVATTLLLSVSTADLDGDGDHEVLLLSTDVNTDTDAGASPLIVRLSAWERTAAGLAERAEVLRLPNVTLPITYEVVDLDQDGDQDVASYERGAPVGYMNDGAFRFTRRVLGDVAPAYADKLMSRVFASDRNRDGALDLTVWTGEALELSMFVLLGDGTGRFRAPGPAAIFEAALVPHGPIGIGVWFADVTGDGLEDIVTQDAENSEQAPMLNLIVSTSATTFAPAVTLPGLGFEFADVDQDGKTDLVTTRDKRLTALLSRPGVTFEARDLGIDMGPTVKDYVVESGAGRPAWVHLLYDLTACPACSAGCSRGRCVSGVCISCLSDGDCAGGPCKNEVCVP